jgi:hypothetical protein
LRTAELSSCQVSRGYEAIGEALVPELARTASRSGSKCGRRRPWQRGVGCDRASFRQDRYGMPLTSIRDIESVATTFRFGSIPPSDRPNWRVPSVRFAPHAAARRRIADERQHNGDGVSASHAVTRARLRDQRATQRNGHRSRRETCRVGRWAIREAQTRSMQD